MNKGELKIQNAKEWGGVMEDNYPIKMGWGCFIPLVIFASIGFLSGIVSLIFG